MCRLSLTMITKDEEKYLARCLESISSIVDEIIIVDTGSTDRTVEIAKSFGATVYDFKWVNDFSAARNFAFEKSTGDWNIVLDADEYITNDCGNTIREFIKQNHAIGKIARTDCFYRDKELQHSVAHISRLAPRTVRYEGRIHEQLVSDLPRINIDVKVFHDGYLNAGKAERNLGILFRELEEKPNDPYILYQIGSTLFISGNFEKAEKYFHGFYKYAPVSANYRYTGVVSYLYNVIALRKFELGLEIIANENVLLNELPDFHFVCGIFYMELVLSDVKRYIKYLPLIEQEYLKCLEIGETDVFDSVAGTGSFDAAYNLGAYYEVSGNTDKALHYYNLSSEWGLKKAEERIHILKQSAR